MSKIKILHAADMHLDSPFEGLPEAKAMIRRREQRALLGKLCDIVKAQRLDLVLLAGDLLDSDSTYAETGEELVKTLGDMGVPVFISPGNHDYYSRFSPYARLSFTENVHIFKNNAVECVELPELNVRVWGAAFTDKFSRPLLKGFEHKKDDDAIDLMCIHGEVGKDGQYNPISRDELAQSGMDYVALGHIHAGIALQKAGGSCYAWPGCPEGRGFDELGAKGVFVVTVGDGECSLEPVTVSSRKYVILPVELGEDAENDVLSALPQGTENDIYRIILRGEQDNAPNLAKLKAALEDKFFSLQLRDETQLRRDIWENAGDDSLRGLFLTRLRAAFDAAKSADEREKIVQAARWGLAALDKREEVVSHEN